MKEESIRELINSRVDCPFSFKIYIFLILEMSESEKDRL